MIHNFAELFKTPINNLKLRHKFNDIDILILLVTVFMNDAEIEDIINTIQKANKQVKLKDLQTRLNYLDNAGIVNVHNGDMWASESTYLYLYVGLAQNTNKANHYNKLFFDMGVTNTGIAVFIQNLIFRNSGHTYQYTQYYLGISRLFQSKEFWSLPISDIGYETIARYAPHYLLSYFYYGNHTTNHVMATPQTIKALASTQVNYNLTNDLNTFNKDSSYFSFIATSIDNNYIDARKNILDTITEKYSITTVIDLLIVKYLIGINPSNIEEMTSAWVEEVNYIHDNNLMMLANNLLVATDEEMYNIISDIDEVIRLLKVDARIRDLFNHIGLLWLLLACFPIRNSIQFSNFKNKLKKQGFIKYLTENKPQSPYIDFLQRVIFDLLDIETTKQPIFKELNHADSLIKKLTSLFTTPAVQEKNERLLWVVTDRMDLMLKVQSKSKKGWTPGRVVEMHKSFYFHTKPTMLLTETDTAIIHSLYRYDYPGRAVMIDKYLLNELARATNVSLEDGTNITFVEQKKLLVLENEQDLIHLNIFPESSNSSLSNRYVNVEMVSEGVYRYDNSDSTTKNALNIIANSPALPLTRKKDIINLISDKLDYYDTESAQGSIKIVPWDEQIHVWFKIDDNTLDMQIRHQSLDGLIQAVSGFGDKWIEVTQGHWAIRDLAKELEDVKTINKALGLKTKKNQYHTDIVLPIMEAGSAIDTLSELENIIFHWHKGSAKVNVLKDKDFKIEISDENGWFKVKGGVEIDGQQFIHFKTLLDAKRTGYITLEQTDVKLILSKALRDKINLIDSVLNDDQKVEQRLAYPLQKLIETMQVSSNKAWKQLETQWQKPIAINNHNLLALRDYQKTSVKWAIHLLSNGFGACLADDMGLGKTIQALKIIAHFSNLGPSLVVAPKSVLHNWQNETYKFTTGIDAIILDNQDDKAETIKSIGANQILIIGYSQVSIFENELHAVKWQTAVLDEAQNIKNPMAKRTQAIMGLDAVGKMTLSGTPIENHLIELWSQFNFINPGLLGSLEQFKDKYGDATKNEQDLARLRALVSPFIMRRLKKQVLTELPEKIEINHSIELSKEERTSYEAIRRKALIDAKTNPIELLAALTRLRQVCCDPHLVFPEVTQISSKLQEAINLIEEGIEGGHKILVFSQFIGLLTRLGAFLKQAKIKYNYLDGQTSLKKRESEIESFKSGKTDLFLISLKAGGTGLNLTEADMVIHLDPWWNPAIEDQASDRAHRMGQTQPVTIYRLVTENTIEEKIIALHQEKRDLAEKVLSGQDDTKRLDPAMLLSLLSD